MNKNCKYNVVSKIKGKIKYNTATYNIKGSQMFKTGMKSFIVASFLPLLFVACANHEAALKVLPNEIAQANECKTENKEFEIDCYDLISYKNSIALIRSGIHAYIAGNHQEAFAKYTLAKERGNFYSNALLADMYNNGVFVKQNQELALELLEEVEKVDPIAAYKLSFQYRNKQDFKKAIRLLDFAAKNNVKKAQEELVKIYQDDKFIPIDKKLSDFWKNEFEQNNNSFINKVYGI